MGSRFDLSQMAPTWGEKRRCRSDAMARSSAASEMLNCVATCYASSAIEKTPFASSFDRAGCSPSSTGSG